MYDESSTTSLLALLMGYKFGIHVLSHVLCLFQGLIVPLLGTTLGVGVDLLEAV